MAARRRAHHAPATGRHLGPLVVADVRRSLLAETPQIEGELQQIVASDHAVGGVLRPARTRRADEGRILVEDVVHPEADLAPPVAENLLADRGAAQKIGVVVVVGDALVLRIGRRRRESESLPEDELEIAPRRMVEVLVVLVAAK